MFCSANLTKRMMFPLVLLIFLIIGKVISRAVLIKFLEVLLDIHLLWKEHTKLFKRKFLKR